MNFLERAFDGLNQWWKYLIVIVVGFVVAQLLGSLPLIFFMKDTGIVGLDFNAAGLDPNLGLLLMLLPFLVSNLMMYKLIKILHKRSLMDVFNGGQPMRWGRIKTSFSLWVGFMALYLLISWLIDPENFIFQLEMASFLPLCVVAILMIPIQTTAEEYLLRGYLTQAIGVLTNNRWAAILLPGVLFALLHITNPEVKEFGFWYVMPQYFVTGFVFGLISVLDDGIELALGAHAANNIFLSLFVTFDSSVLQTSAVFHQQAIDPLHELIALIAMNALFVFVLARKYGWDFSILAKKINVA